MQGAAPIRPLSEIPFQTAATASQNQPGAFAPEGGEDEISLLDLLLVVAENARLLIFGPLVAGLAGAAGLNIKNPADTYVALIKSRSVADRVIDRFDLMNIYEQKLRQNDRMALENATKVSTGKDCLIAIEVDDKDPRRAADMASA